MAYPTSLDNLPANKTNATTSSTDHPDHHNDLATAINAIEVELGLTPSSTSTTVATRFAAVLQAIDDGDDATLLAANTYTDGPATVNTRAAPFTLNAADLGAMVSITGSGTITLPAGLGQPGDSIGLCRTASGVPTLATSGAAVIHSGGAELRDISPQWARATLFQLSTNLWQLSGGLA